MENETETRAPEVRVPRWSSPMEWLFEKVDEEWDSPRTKAIVEELLHYVPHKTIQDCFEKQMAEEGYWEGAE